MKHIFLQLDPHQQDQAVIAGSVAVDMEYYYSVKLSDKLARELKNNKTISFDGGNCPEGLEIWKRYARGAALCAPEAVTISLVDDNTIEVFIKDITADMEEPVTKTEFRARCAGASEK